MVLALVRSELHSNQTHLVDCAVDFAKFGPEKIEIDQNTIVYSTDG